MSELNPGELARRQLARDQLALMIADYGVEKWAAMTASDADQLPAEQTPKHVIPVQAEAAAKIVVTATFDAEGVWLESDMRTRRSLYLPKSGARRHDSPHTNDVKAIRRDISWTILSHPGKEFSHIEFKPFLPTDDPKERNRLITMLFRWWGEKLRIGGHELVIPWQAQTWSTFRKFTLNPIIELDLKGDPKAPPPES